MEKLDLELLEKIAKLHSVPEGSFNIRKNGERLAANSTDEIQIVQKTDKPGIDIIVAAGVKNKSVHIPVILTVGDFQDTVYNDFFIGEDADVTIVAGCGIHNPGKGKAEHDGVHTFHLGKNSRVKYVERHYGEGVQGSKRVFDPVTNAFLESGSVLEMDTTQLGGVTFTDRMTEAVVGDGAKLLVKEKLLTDGDEKAISRFRVTLKGKDSTCDIVSRSVARGTRHHPGRRAHPLHPADRRRTPRRQPRARSGGGQDRRRPAHQTHEPRAYGEGGGGRCDQRLPPLTLSFSDLLCQSPHLLMGASSYSKTLRTDFSSRG